MLIQTLIHHVVLIVHVNTHKFHKKIIKMLVIHFKEMFFMRKSLQNRVLKMDQGFQPILDFVFPIIQNVTELIKFMENNLIGLFFLDLVIEDA